MKSNTLLLSLLFAGLVVGCGEGPSSPGTNPSPQNPGEQLTAGPYTVHETELSAQWQGSELTVELPLSNSGSATSTGSWSLTVSHISGEPTLSNTGEFDAQPGQHPVQASISGLPELEGAAAQAEYVLSYSFKLGSYELWGKRSVFHLIPKAELILVAPETLQADQPSALRAFLLDPISGQPLADREITVEVSANDSVQDTVSGRTDELGIVVLELPGGAEGQKSLTAKISNADVEGEAEASVRVIRESKVLLTTDKPLYQPGQIMHLRALGLERFARNPLANEEVLFEVSDAKGNKVFKASDTTNDFGVASARFQLASQVNLGTYQVRVTVGEVISEKSVTVDRYTLPKFKVDADIERPFYLAGQTVTGTVQADYFFGKPVAGGTVHVTPYKYEGTWTPMTEITGQTNDAGLYAFSFDLPDYLVGQPLDAGKAMILLEIAVTDTAAQEVKVANNLIIANEALELVLIPESGQIVSGVKNTVYVFATDPTGRSVEANCTLSVGNASISESDEQLSIPSSGPAAFTLSPDGAGTVTIAVEATDSLGNSATQDFSFNVGDESASVLLRTDRATYAVGDTMSIEVHATGGHGHLFLDIIRKNQTVLTKTLELSEGVATHVVDLDAELTEDLVIDVYMLADSGQFIRDTQVVYVQPASDLRVSVSTDKEQYEPGETARISFEVTDQDNNPVSSALGIQVVDEAVYALSEIKPGLLKLYFQLEEELAQPTYQLGAGMGFSFGSLFAAGAAAEPGSEEDAAIQDTTKAAFAALGGSPLSQQEVSSWTVLKNQVETQLRPHFVARKDLIAEALAKVVPVVDGYVEIREICQLLSDHLANTTYEDFWGTPMLIEAHSHSDWDCPLSLQSAGLDETMDTDDDWRGSLQLWDISDDFARAMPDFGVEEGGWDEDAMPAAEGEPNAGGPYDDGGEDSGGNDDVRVRSWFPETLLVEPSLITDDSGKAELDLLLADSITQWRMTTLGSSKQGHLGSRTDGITVFQDFFVDIDFPKYLTQNDEVRFPIAVYNYLEEAQTVTVEVEPADWFELMGPSQVLVQLEPGEVKGLGFPVRVTEVGWHSLTVYGIGGDQAKDAIMRTVEVKPDGKAIIETVSARFANDGESQSTDHIVADITIPDNSITNSESVVIKVLPGLSSHIVEGMDSMFNLPGGCMEQTTSSAWPNVLALQYMRASGTITPEIEMTAINYVNSGYQRILTFECDSGGFNWWEGDNPGNAILSAVAIKMLTDTKTVYDTVDEAVIQRSCDYLDSTQQSDGSWTEERHLHAGNENLGAGSLRATCYIAWAMAEGCPNNPKQLERAINKITTDLPGETSDYTKGMCANALIAANEGSDLVSSILDGFHESAIVDDDNVVHWEPEGDTLVNSGGVSANVEITALIALAMAERGVYPNDVNGAVEYMVRTKDPMGNWGYNTQATVLALKTFLTALNMGSGDTSAEVSVLIDGAVIANNSFDDFNKDVVWQVEAPEGLGAGDHVIELDYDGIGSLSYQIVATHYVPWEEAELPEGPLSIDVSYDATSIAVDDTITATVTLTHTDETAKGAILVTVGLPPGFSLVTEDLASLKAEGRISSFEVLGKQLLLYLDEIPVGEPTVLSYGLVAQYPVSAQTGGADVKYYYNAAVKGETESQEIVVTEN